jgi:putative transposase
MSRLARIALEDVPYHITQRGNAQQQVFFEERDYRLYMDSLGKYCEAVALRIWAYCLMPNHVHLIVNPERNTAMAGAMARVNADFARYFNLGRLTCGHVWQSRYFSTPMDEAHLWQAMAYVERNPVRAGLVARADEYAWSSARLRRPGAAGSFVDLSPWRQHYDWDRWKTVLETSVGEEAFGLRLQEASRRGRPFGGAEFTEVLEQRSGRKLEPLPTGRPKKVKEKIDGEQLSLGIGV